MLEGASAGSSVGCLSAAIVQALIHYFSAKNRQKQDKAAEHKEANEEATERAEVQCQVLHDFNSSSLSGFNADDPSMHFRLQCLKKSFSGFNASSAETKQKLLAETTSLVPPYCLGVPLREDLKHVDAPKKSPEAARDEKWLRVQHKVRAELSTGFKDGSLVSALHAIVPNDCVLNPSANAGESIEANEESQVKGNVQKLSTPDNSFWDEVLDFDLPVRDLNKIKAIENQILDVDYGSLGALDAQCPRVRLVSNIAEDLLKQLTNSVESSTEGKEANQEPKAAANRVEIPLNVREERKTSIEELSKKVLNLKGKTATLKVEIAQLQKDVGGDVQGPQDATKICETHSADYEQDVGSHSEGTEDTKTTCESETADYEQESLDNEKNLDSDIDGTQGATMICATESADYEQDVGSNSEGTEDTKTTCETETADYEQEWLDNEKNLNSDIEGTKGATMICATESADYEQDVGSNIEGKSHFDTMLETRAIIDDCYVTVDLMMINSQSTKKSNIEGKKDTKTTCETETADNKQECFDNDKDVNSDIKGTKDATKICETESADCEQDVGSNIEGIKDTKTTCETELAFYIQECFDNEKNASSELEGTKDIATICAAETTDNEQNWLNITVRQKRTSDSQSLEDAPKARVTESVCNKYLFTKAPKGRLSHPGATLQNILAARRDVVDADGDVFERARADDASAASASASSNDSAANQMLPSGKLPASGNLQDFLACRREVCDATGESFEGGGVPLATSTLQMDPLPIALLFPNQGSEVVGMLDGAHKFPPAAALLRQAQSILDYDVVKVCTDDELLGLPHHGHVALYVAEVVAAERLRSERPEAVERCSAVAGIGLGEFAALVVAGVMDFEQGLELVKVRAELMEAAAEAAPGKLNMLHIIGIQASQVRDLCEEAIRATGDDSVCEIVSILLPDNCTCAGSERAVARLKVLAESATPTSRKISAKFLDSVGTKGAFQTSLMTSAQNKFHFALSKAKLRPPRCSVFFNSTGAALPAGSQPEHIVELLATQLTSTILWLPAIEQMIKDGIEDFFELGPGRKLRTIMQRINSEKWRRTKCIAPCCSLRQTTYGGG